MVWAVGEGSWKHWRRVMHSYGSINEVHGWNVLEEMARHSEAKSPPAMHVVSEFIFLGGA